MMTECSLRQCASCWCSLLAPFTFNFIQLIVSRMSQYNLMNVYCVCHQHKKAILYGNGAGVDSTGGLLFLLIFMSTDSIKKYLEPIQVIKLFTVVSRIEIFGCIYTASVHRTNSQKNSKKPLLTKRETTERMKKTCLEKKRCQVDKRFLGGFFFFKGKMFIPLFTKFLNSLYSTAFLQIYDY